MVAVLPWRCGLAVCPWWSDPTEARLPSSHAVFHERGRFPPILKVSLLCCAAVAAVLGLFAVGGDQLGLWEPLNPVPPQAAAHATKKSHRAAAKKAHRSRTRAARRVPASPQRAEAVPRPPVPARPAFLIAALAAALAALASVLQDRRPIRALRRGVGAIGPAAVHVIRPARAARTTTIARPQLLPGVQGELIAPLARHAAYAGGKLIDALRSAPRRWFDRLERLNGVATPMLRSMTIGLGRTVGSRKAVARVALTAAATGFWKAREKWRLRPRGTAPYLVSFALAVVVGWLVGTH
jgi:hypothetical protein